MFMLNVCVLCKVMCISDVCTFFDCQVPIFFIARCQYQTQRWEEIANGTWGGETDQFEVEKEMRMSLSLHWHNLDFCVLFQWVLQSQVYSIYQSTLIPIQCHIWIWIYPNKNIWNYQYSVLMFSIWQPFHPTSTNLSSVTNEHGLWIRSSCPQGHNLLDVEKGGKGSDISNWSFDERGVKRVDEKIKFGQVLPVRCNSFFYF